MTQTQVVCAVCGAEPFMVGKMYQVVFDGIPGIEGLPIFLCDKHLRRLVVTEVDES